MENVPVGKSSSDATSFVATPAGRAQAVAANIRATGVNRIVEFTG